MVRFELDAASSIPKMESESGTKSDEDKDDIVKMMGNASVKSSLRPLPSLTEKLGGINIHRSPFPSPPLSTFIESKTRAMRGDLDYVDIYSQLVFSQTPNLYVARHMRGSFQTLEKVRLGEGRLEGIAKAADGVLGNVGVMLHEMVTITKEHGGVSFVWSGKGMEVGVWKFDGQPPLSTAATEMLR